MPDPLSRLACAGCGHEVAATEPLPLRCPNGGRDDADHVLQRRLAPGAGPRTGDLAQRFEEPESMPFLAFRRLLHSYQIATANGLADAAFVRTVESLDAAVEAVDGRGFRVTPFLDAPRLATALGVGSAAVKDETGNVSGTHKGRHLMGTLLWLELVPQLFPEASERAGAPLVIASCGNAAHAAAVLARAARRPLEAFIPPRANPWIVDRLRALGATATTCPRSADVVGDPCLHAFHRSVAAGSLPFSCQGPDNALALDGGRTLAWELVAASGGRLPDDLFIQVGGGVLASSCIQGLREARDLGALQTLPRILAVQAERASPLQRAWKRLVARILEQAAAEGGGAPASDDPGETARFVRDAVPREIRDATLRWAATHRSDCMWPLETEPRSLSDAILDDETYDWLEVVRGLLETGGFPVLVSDALLRDARRLARETTSIDVGVNGASGLAGCLRLAREGLLDPDRSVTLLFTGIQRRPEIG